MSRIPVQTGEMTAVLPHLVEEVLGVEMRPVDVAGIQRRRLLLGLPFLVQPVVELQHAVHLTLPAGAGVLRHGNRAVGITVHSVESTAERRHGQTTINKDDGRLTGSPTLAVSEYANFWLQRDRYLRCVAERFFFWKKRRFSKKNI